MQSIHTLNARGHLMLGTIRDFFKIGASAMRNEILRMHEDTIRILASKKIDYDSLRSALVPKTDKHEAAFVFDSTEIESGAYGPEVISRVLPLLDKRVTQSVLCGDILCKDQELAFEVLKESMLLSRSFAFRHSSLLYAVYLNNLSSAAVAKIHEGLAGYPAYLGYIPTTNGSRAKTILSFSLVNLFLKHGNTIILGHEDDRPNSEDINITRYPLENSGYRIASLQSNYFGIYLSYKIERPVFAAFEEDSEMALNAISETVGRLGDFTVALDEAKHAYLLNAKQGKLGSAGLADADRNEIAALIQSKINSSYIYNLEYLKDFDVAKFNLIVELNRPDGNPARRMAALEYKPAEKVLRVLTFF
ncbi:hypothetical protein [Massilia timonae]|uniref:Uncharacterized protein n=1 Tax=Massilia timonae TaxID=47229 RepID=A0A1S2NC71_9BURK|nr:hypothetical protein [Massilia timonae]OIJ42274.1 hypothetical protein LO55_2863 [Massilia timonae]